MAKLLDIAPGGRTQYAIIGTAILNVAILALEIVGISLPDGVWQGINTALGLVISLFLADKVDTGNATVARVEAKQPSETPVVVVTTNGSAKVEGSGVDVIRP
jgi:hypothetical protein